MAKAKNKKQIAKKTLLAVLAQGSTEEAQKLLEKNTGQRGRDYSDLEYKLAQFYANSTDKPTLEKEFAEIHPHKDFILKYVSPKVEIEPMKAESETTEIKLGADGHSNCEGNPNCNCNKQTEPMQGFIGSQPMVEGAKSNDNMILGVIGIVAILSLVVIYKK